MIGPGGEKIKEIQKKSKARIQVRRLTSCARDVQRLGCTVCTDGRARSAGQEG
jgi:hypothetical protein